MRHRTSLPILLVFSAIAIWPPSALADAIIPYLWVPFGQLLLFPLVVLLEALVIWRMLQGGIFRALWHSFIVNLASTVVGAVLYFATMPLVGEHLYNIWQRAWLQSVLASPWQQKAVSISIAFGFALALFAVSWLVEAGLLIRLRRATPCKRVIAACGVGNALTYIILLLLTSWVA